MLDFNDTLILPKLSEVNSRKDVQLKVNIAKGVYGVPICLANLDTLGTVMNAEIASRHGLFTCLDKRIKKNIENTFITFGLEDIDELRKNVVKYREYKLVCLDIANGYIKKFRDLIKEVRQLLPEAFLLAGNVATVDGASALYENGCDMVKVGIGPGGLCKTREVTGVGYPQLQAVYECSQVCPVMCDGGLRNTGDFCKVFVAGASMVMAGSYFLSNCKAYGMASKDAQIKYGNDRGGTYGAYEGRSKVFEDKGSLEDIIQQLLGGIRSCCTYCDCSSIYELKDKTRLIKC